MQPPPRDALGKVVPHDHEEILQEDFVVRRISVHHIIGGRVSSMAFQESSDGSGMSLDIEKLIEAAGLNSRDFVTNESWPAAVSFSAGQLRALGLQVGYDPLPENAFHGAAWGISSKAMQRRVKGAAQWYVAAEGVSL